MLWLNKSEAQANDGGDCFKIFLQNILAFNKQNILNYKNVFSTWVSKFKVFITESKINSFR